MNVRVVLSRRPVGGAKPAPLGHRGVRERRWLRQRACPSPGKLSPTTVSIPF